MYELANALKNVNIADIGDVTLTKLVRDTLNQDLRYNNMNRVSTAAAARIAKALKMVERQAFQAGCEFVAGG